MADSDAVRQARRRRHRAGDHSTCGRRCEASRAPVKIAPVAADAGRDLNPAAALRALAVQLREAYTADPGNSLLAREYRQTLQALTPAPGAGADAEFATLVAELSRPVPREEDGRW